MNTDLNVQEFEKAYKTNHGKILDVRTPAEYEAGHLDDAINMDWLGGELHSKLSELDKSETYYLYCASGNRSNMATTYLKQQGFRSVYNIGGYSGVMNASI